MSTNGETTIVGAERPTLDADTIVVVGGREFHENSYLLRAVSHYFDAAFRIGMKEAKDKRFEFPGRDPEEWELLMSICSPFPTGKLDKNNVTAVLSWCDELDITAGMEQCDNVLSTYIRNVPCFTDTSDLFQVWALSSEKMLPLTKRECLAVMKNVIEHCFKSLKAEDWKFICLRLLEDKENRDELWEDLRRKMPHSTTKGKAAEELLENELTPELLYSHTKFLPEDPREATSRKLRRPGAEEPYVGGGYPFAFGTRGRGATRGRGRPGRIVPRRY
ncbi:MAG: hypothetical protein SGARI_003674 [Bacillariaceae sp.]